MPVITSWKSGLVRRLSPSAKDYPEDGWQEVSNAIPLGSEIRRRSGSSELYSGEGGYNGLSFDILSGIVYDSGGIDYIIEHIDTKVFFSAESQSPIAVEDTATSTDLVAINGLSSMIQIGKHILFMQDVQDDDEHGFNYIINFDSGGSPKFTARRAGMQEFLGTLLTAVTLTETNVGAGSILNGEYNYMFTLARYDGSTLISEGAGYDELAFDAKSIKIESGPSDVKIDFTNVLSLLPGPGTIIGNATHFNLFRSLNISQFTSPFDQEELYHDSEQSKPIWPFYRFVNKLAVASTGGTNTFTDTNADATLKNVLDTYDTRGWKPLPRIKFGHSAPNGRIFFVRGDFNGRIHFTENAISPNRDITKFYEHWPAGFNYFIDLGLDSEQLDKGFSLSPIGDLLIGQDTRIFRIHQADPLRLDFLGRLRGHNTVRIDNSHGFLNERCNVLGSDGKLYILGNHGYKAFDGDSFEDRDFLQEIDLPHLLTAANVDRMHAVYYPGSKRVQPDGKNGFNQILLHYPSVDGGATDRALVVIFRGGTRAVTEYRGYSSSSAKVLPTDGRLIITESVASASPAGTLKMFVHDDGTSNVDRSGTDDARIEYFFRLKDYSHDDQAFTIVLDTVGVFGRNIDKDFEIRPFFDGVRRLERRVVTPNVDAIQIVNVTQFRDNRRYEAEFDDDAIGHTIAPSFFTRALIAPVLESIDVNFLSGERMV